MIERERGKNLVGEEEEFIHYRICNWRIREREREREREMVGIESGFPCIMHSNAFDLFDVFVVGI